MSATAALWPNRVAGKVGEHRIRRGAVKPRALYSFYSFYYYYPLIVVFYPPMLRLYLSMWSRSHSHDGIANH